ncbi:MAG: hypothetical protein B7Z67_12890 [Acidiphilium sp. 21-60-14]|nr:MAG: hypothetical protein B7Z67_12890 [Acidiphilium sp. 21-60-14]OZB40176.1 MAG: hypothetical protein B7X48_06165 [Acidiphilium sp. 34-60-192]
MLRIAIIGAATTDLLARAIAVATIQEARLPIIQQGLFGAYVQDILDPTSSLYQFAPDLIVIIPTWRDLITPLPPNAPAATIAEADAATIARAEHLWSILTERLPNTRIIHHLPPPPPTRLTGIAERTLPTSPIAQHTRLSQSLLEVGAGRVIFLDLARLTAERGLRATASERFWHAAKLPFDQSALPAYVPAFRATLRAALSRQKKALVLDLDNTLWGGVIGDDGVNGIKLGAGTPTGEAFAAFQAYAADLRARGIILAVCSKNDPAIAATGFTHPASILRRDDFAAFECAWTDKPQSLRRIAESLNIGLDAIVFADDNHAECALVRAELPEITTIELGADPATFIDRIEAGYWFDTQSFAAEDFIRASAYTARAAAASAQADATDLDSFLASLDMHARWFTPTGADITRTAQLSNKTNQFNLTTRRYPEILLQTRAADPQTLIRALSLRDKFGDHGLVSALITSIQDTTLIIDEWIMSCRVFSRTAEHFIINHLINDAQSRNLTHIIGTFCPTEKNQVVATLYPSLGFSPTGDNHWTLTLPAAPRPTFITGTA